MQFDTFVDSVQLFLVFAFFSGSWFWLVCQQQLINLQPVETVSENMNSFLAKTPGKNSLWLEQSELIVLTWLKLILRVQVFLINILN